MLSYVFPSIGMGAILSKATTITQSMIYASATSLANSLSYSEEDEGYIYPAIERIRDVSVFVTMGVIRAAQEARVDREVRIREMGDAELESWVRSKMYDPHHESRNVEKEIKNMVHGLPSGSVTPLLNGSSKSAAATAVNGERSHL